MGRQARIKAGRRSLRAMAAAAYDEEDLNAAAEAIATACGLRMRTHAPKVVRVRAPAFNLKHRVDPPNESTDDTPELWDSSYRRRRLPPGLLAAMALSMSAGSPR